MPSSSSKKDKLLSTNSLNKAILPKSQTRAQIQVAQECVQEDDLLDHQGSGQLIIQYSPDYCGDHSEIQPNLDSGKARKQQVLTCYRSNSRP